MVQIQHPVVQNSQFQEAAYALEGYASVKQMHEGTNPMAVARAIRTPLCVINAVDDPVCSVQVRAG